MDLYEMARVDTKVGIEQTMKNLIKLREEGHFKYIGLSECSAETIRKAAAVGPVSAVEVEFSPFCPADLGLAFSCRSLSFGLKTTSPLDSSELTLVALHMST